MPYLNSKIKKHNKGCRRPSAKRLYIRDYDDKGRQKFVSYGVTCPSCGVLVTEEYQRNPTAIKKEKYQFEKVYTKEQNEIFATIDLKYLPQIIFRQRGKNPVIPWRDELVNAGMTKSDAGKYIIKFLKDDLPPGNSDEKMPKEFYDVLDRLAMNLS